MVLVEQGLIQPEDAQQLMAEIMGGAGEPEGDPGGQGGPEGYAQGGPEGYTQGGPPEQETQKQAAVSNALSMIASTIFPA
jgi:hypothetical protein